MRFFCMLCIGFVVDNCLWNNDKWQNGKNSLLIWKGSVFLSAQLWIVLLQVQLPFLQSVGELLVVCLGQSNGLDQSEVSIVVTWPVSTNHSSPGPPSRSWLSRRRRLGGRGGRWRGARWRGPAWSPASPWSTRRRGQPTWPIRGKHCVHQSQLTRPQYTHPLDQSEASIPANWPMAAHLTTVGKSSLVYV